MKKFLAVAVILLFIGLAVAPSINANVSKEALVEFTTEVCGLNGGKQTVKLTQEEADEVEDLFDSIRERLDATDTREEAEEVFKEAVVELYKYGLLGGLSVKQAQKLVTGGDYNSKRIHDLLPTIIGKKKTNALCLVNGNMSDRNMFPLSFPVAMLGVIGEFFQVLSLPFAILLGVLLLSSYPNISLWVIPLFILFVIPFSIFLLFFLLSFIYMRIFPVSVLNIIGIENNYNSSNQWIRINGIVGEDTYEGNITGSLFGYTGLKILSTDNMFHLLGFALLVSLSED